MDKARIVLISLIILLVITGCSLSKSDKPLNIKQYFGMTREEAVAVLGNPATISFDRYTLEWNEKQLPSSLTSLSLTFSKWGLCQRINGQLKTKKSVMAVFDLIGFSDLQNAAERVRATRLTVAASTHPYEVRITEISNTSKTFSVSNSEAGFSLKVIESQVGEDYAGKNFTGSIFVDGDSSDWQGIAELIKDSVGEVSRPDDCDLKSIRAAMDSEYVYLLIEMATGWSTLYAKTNASGALGWVYLNTDGDRTTGWKSMEQNDYEVDPVRTGAEYLMYITTGFSMTVNRNGVSSSQPMVAFDLYQWDEYSSDWQEVDFDTEKHIAFGGPFIELRLPRSFVQIDAGSRIDIGFNEQNSWTPANLNLARGVVLPQFE